jgi:hypothetical protein
MGADRVPSSPCKGVISVLKRFNQGLQGKQYVERIGMHSFIDQWLVQVNRWVERVLQMPFTRSIRRLEGSNHSFEGSRQKRSISGLKECSQGVERVQSA